MLPTDSKARKALPIYSGFICYFPHAIAAVAQLSKIGNDQHNPGQPLHWAKEKSSDEMDALVRHITDQAISRTHRDPDGVLAAVKKAWRSLADLERMHDEGIDIFAVPVPVPVPAKGVYVCPSCLAREGEQHSIKCQMALTPDDRGRLRFGTRGLSEP